jgi:hypothetical protein
MRAEKTLVFKDIKTVGDIQEMAAALDSEPDVDANTRVVFEVHDGGQMEPRVQNVKIDNP